MSSFSISEQFESIYTFDNSPTDVNSSFFEVMVIDAWSRYFIKLLRRFVRQLTTSFVPHISWHDLPYRRTLKRYENFEGMVMFQITNAEIRDSNMVL